MDYEKILKKNNLKVTNSRVQILNIINVLDIDATNKNILDNVDIDKSTVYRIIELFINKNVVEKNLNYQDEVYYSIKQEHMHFIRCVKCHKKEQINICPVSDLEEKGYTIINHKIEIDGICNNCSKKI